MASEPIRGIRTCVKCGVQKPTGKPYFVVRMKAGKPCVASECNDCRNAARRTPWPPLSEHRNCKRCSVAFLPLTIRQSYCSTCLIEKRRIARRGYNKRNPDVISASSDKWRSQNPDVNRAGARRYKMRKRAVHGSHTTAEFHQLCERHNWTCTYCRKTIEPNLITRDHAIPISRGGSDNIYNIVPSCRSCNSSKGALTKDEFIAARLAT